MSSAVTPTRTAPPPSRAWWRRGRRPRVGDRVYRDGRGGARWTQWNGRRWARARHSAQPRLLLSPAALSSGPELPTARRIAVLREALTQEVLAGASVELCDDLTAVLSYPRPVSHWAHALLTVVTGGLWALVWLAMILTRTSERQRFEIDRQGHVWASVAER